MPVEKSLLEIANVVSVRIHVFTFDACLELTNLFLIETNMIVFLLLLDKSKLALHRIDLRLDIGTCELQLSLKDYSFNLLG